MYRICKLLSSEIYSDCVKCSLLRAKDVRKYSALVTRLKTKFPCTAKQHTLNKELKEITRQQKDQTCDVLNLPVNKYPVTRTEQPKCLKYEQTNQQRSASKSDDRFARHDGKDGRVEETMHLGTKERKPEIICKHSDKNDKFNIKNLEERSMQPLREQRPEHKSSQFDTKIKNDSLIKKKKSTEKSSVAKPAEVKQAHERKPYVLSSKEKTTKAKSDHSVTGVKATDPKTIVTAQKTVPSPSGQTTKKRSEKSVASKQAETSSVNETKKKSYYQKYKSVRRYDPDILKERIPALLMDNQYELAARQIQREQRFLASQFLTQGLKVDISVYNCLLRSCAKEGNYKNVRAVLRQLDMWRVTPDLQTYAHCLECLARNNKFDAVEGYQILSQLYEQNLDVRDIFKKCSFVKDEWFFVEKALKMLDPEFVARPPLPPPDYTCELVQSLNTPLQDGVEMPYRDSISKEKIMENLENQLKWEMDGHVEVSTMLHEKEELTPVAVVMRKRLEAVKQQWRDTLTTVFVKKLKESQYGPQVPYRVRSIVSYLRLLPASEIVDLLMMELDNIFETCIYLSPSTSTMHKDLAEKVLDKCILRYCQENGILDKKKEVYLEFLDYYTADEQKHRSIRECFKSIMQQEKHRYGPTLDKPSFEWGSKTLKDVGEWLYGLLLEHVKFDPTINKEKRFDHKKKKTELVPVLYVINNSYGYRVVEEIMPHPAITRLYQQSCPATRKFNAAFMPMLIPPVPWLSTYTGGMLIKPTELIKTNKHFVTENPNDRIVESDINPVLDALNILSCCPWKINQEVLDLMLDVFNSKKGNEKLNIVPHVSTLPPLPKVKLTMNKKELFAVYEAKKKMKKIHKENYSLWCTTLYQLAIANKLRENTIWFPHNIDFRGRAYPVSPSMNYMGNDLMRGLLKFAKGKPLGEKGFRWLKIHVINLMGLKKRSSNEERLAFAEEMMEEILDSADNPMTGNRWWQASEDPWTTLAACKEIAAAVRSPDPVKYVSHLPVHQDGSCNGLQHYAALGRDQKGAESVNLCPFHEPKDVYSDVVELVEEQRARDAANGIEIAKKLEGFVTRKTIKQTVMTTVYGVTLYGAMKQILRNMSEVEGKVLSESDRAKASSYLAKTTLQTISKIFHASREIQDWFIKIAQVLSINRKTLSEWETPLGLPVVQPYSKNIGVDEYRPNTMKQKNSFPPNFIHSLDATHMMLTALHCQRQGITYVSVHDCYWTHACDVDIMSKITREQFVLLHSQPILENLSNFLLEKFVENPSSEYKEKEKTQAFIKKTFSTVPARGDLDLNKVLDSVYFFS